MSAGANFTLGITASATVVAFPTNFIGSNIICDPTSTITYQCNANQVINKDFNYGNLILSSGAAASSKSPPTPSTLSILGNLTINTSTTLQGANVIINLDGSILAGTGTLNFTTGTLNIKGSNNAFTGSYVWGAGSTINFISERRKICLRLKLTPSKLKMLLNN